MHVKTDESQDIHIDAEIVSQSAFYANPELDPSGFMYGKRYTLIFTKDGYKDYKLSFKAFYQNEFSVEMTKKRTFFRAALERFYRCRDTGCGDNLCGDSDLGNQGAAGEVHHEAYRAPSGDLQRRAGRAPEAAAQQGGEDIQGRGVLG